jgi:hypothetical protein
MEVERQSIWGTVKQTARENKWLVFFTILFFLILLVPVLFR